MVRCAPLVPVTFWVIATTKVMLFGPKARTAVICPVPVAICYCCVRSWATPGVANPRAMTAASCAVTRPLSCRA